MSKNVVVVGIGNIGRRYLQSLVSMGYDWNIYAVEKRVDAIIPLRKEFPEVKFCEDISSVPEIIDLCAITTTSDVRSLIVEEVLDTKHVRYMVLEKVLFQRVKDYDYVKNLLEINKVKAWVNHTDRETKGYKWLKNRIKDVEQFTVQISGCEWGLCCNALHYLDKIKFLSNSEDELSVDFDSLTGPIVESKRKGFYEVYGNISGSCGPCKHYDISCIQGDRNVPLTVTITCNSGVYIVNESNHTVEYMCAEDGYTEKKKEFVLEYTSCIMGRIFNEILESGACGLPDYNSSMKTHLLFIEGIRNYMNNYGLETDLCPIT